LFLDYEQSLDGKIAPPALQYHIREKALSCEYLPLVEMIEKYDPENAFVGLVAIRTGDKRDSLMKVMIIGAYTQSQMHFPNPKKFSQLLFTGMDQKNFSIKEGCAFCSNTLCPKLEEEANTFKSCSGCRSKKYCSKECQVMHWRLGHKSQCDNDKKQLERLVDVELARRSIVLKGMEDLLNKEMGKTSLGSEKAGSGGTGGSTAASTAASAAVARAAAQSTAAATGSAPATSGGTSTTAQAKTGEKSSAAAGAKPESSADAKKDGSKKKEEPAKHTEEDEDGEDEEDDVPDAAPASTAAPTRPSAPVSTSTPAVTVEQLD